MLSTPALSSLEIFLTVEHAARAADLLAAGVPLQASCHAALLQRNASTSFLGSMSYKQATMCVGSTIQLLVLVPMHVAGPASSHSTSCPDNRPLTTQHASSRRSPGAIVHDSPHPYPNRAEISEVFTIP